MSIISSEEPQLVELTNQPEYTGEHGERFKRSAVHSSIDPNARRTQRHSIVGIFAPGSPVGARDHREGERDRQQRE